MMLLRMAWLNLWRNRRRTLITAASVYFAVILAIIMRSATLGVYDNMIHNFVTFSSGYMQVHQKGYWEESNIDNAMEHRASLVDTFGRVLGVTAVIPRLQSFVLASGADQTKGAMVMGIIPSLERSATRLSEKLTTGGYPRTDTDRVALLGEELAFRLKLKAGDTLVLIGQGYRAASAAGMFRVAGLLQLGSPELNQRMIFLPLKRAQEMFGAEFLVTSLAIQVGNPSTLETVHQRLRQVLDTGRLEVKTWKEMYPEMDQFITADSSGHIIMSGILYLMISFGLLGTLLMMTMERTHEFGILIALGLRKSKIGAMLLCESVFIALMGCATGMLSGFGIVWWFDRNPIRLTGQLRDMYIKYGIEPVIALSNRPEVFYVQAIVVLVISVVLVSVPVWKVMRIKPVEAINS